MKLEGKVAIVTGGAQGIGQVIVRCLAKEGTDVVIADINFDAAKRTADEVKAMGRKALAIEADLTDSKKIKQVVQQTMDTFGKIDILVNNVGGLGEIRYAKTLPNVVSFVDEEEAEWDESFKLNLKSHVLMSQAVVPHLIKQKSGKIVNISSISGRTPHPSPYSTFKAGDIALTKGLAKELAGHNINVNCVCPGQVYTAFHERLICRRIEDKDPEVMGVEPREYFEKMATSTTPLKRPQTPEDIGHAVVFLVSEDSKNITGHTLDVNGGRYMN